MVGMKTQRVCEKGVRDSLGRQEYDPLLQMHNIAYAPMLIILSYVDMPWHLPTSVIVKRFHT
jgi:hypothetical protein